MLQSLKHWASGWVASVLIGLLVLSFAIWGVADVFTGYGAGSLATVGDRTITADEYQRAYQNEINAISRQAKRRITFEQARAVGLDRRVLNRLVSSAAIEQHAGDLNLALSDAALLKGIESDPEMQGPGGKFSKDALRSTLRQIGMSEKTFMALRKRDELSKQVTGALLGATTVPTPMVGNLHDWRKENRVLQHVTIDAEKLVNIDKPSEETLKQTYEDNKSQFRSKPMRHLAILLLSVSELKKGADVKDDKVKEAYEATRAEYDTPEKRRVDQISFPDRAAADAAKKAIDGGQDFVEAAKATGAKESDIQLGLLDKKAMIDKKIADAAFSLEKDKVSDVVEGRFTTVLLRVSEIQPAILSTLESAKDRVRNKLATETAESQLQTVYNDIDDGRAAGKPLEEIAEQLKLTFIDIAATDRTNKTPTGTSALDVPDAGQIVRAGFNGDIGLESEPVQLTDGGYAWVDVLGVTPAKQKTFDEVKTDVEKFWTDKERDQAVAKLGRDFVQRIKGGEDFDKVATDAGGAAQKTLSITRAIVPEGLTHAAVEQAFLLPKGGVGSAATGDGKSRTIIKVVEIEPAKAPTDEEQTALTTELAQQLQSDQIGAFIDALRAKHGVSIDDKVFQRLSGADPDAQ